jgi:hypothetical protein
LQISFSYNETIQTGKSFAQFEVPWQKLRDQVEVKLLSQGQAVHMLAKRPGRREKEMAIRRKKLARLLRTLRVLRRTRQRPWKRDTVLHPSTRRFRLGFLVSAGFGRKPRAEGASRL